MLSILEELNQTTTTSLSIGGFIICVIAALVLGSVFSYLIQLKNRTSQSFAVTLAVLPAVVAVVIMMVNGSIGAGIAVAGSFSLVRFRSAPGTGREIASVFISMAIGLICGMGYLLYGVIFTGLIIAAVMFLEKVDFGLAKKEDGHRVLRITIPEDLDYTDIFNDVMHDFTKEYQLMNVKTINLGSLFRLTYHLELNDIYEEKEFIDQLRVRNGNLEINCMMMPTEDGDL